MVRMVRPVCLIVLLGAFASVAVSQEKATTDEVALKKVTYAELGKLVRDQKGKVVIVDFWINTCKPCKDNFPHLLEVAKARAADGLVTLSVNLDDPAEEGAAEKALKFLTKVHSTVPNLILDERTEVWQEKLGSNTVPLVFIFDREGKAYKFPPEAIDRKAIDQLLGELLQKK
jgi:thiol-disulfide isomerase/thioredoxin